jgi:oligopeptide/dipeptide ABC transporter ATP-binding protein
MLEGLRPVAARLMPAGPSSDTLVRVEGLTVHFPVDRRLWGAPKSVVHALDNVSFDIARGETVGLVGESGSGKTTAGRALLRLIDATAGRILFDDTDVTHLRGEELRRMRRRMQLVFQDPYASLNPRAKVLTTVAEPLVVQKVVRRTAHAKERVAELLEKVGLPADAMYRYPHAFSGGQMQRLGIARALALRPDFIVADEPLSALDVSIQAQVLNLLTELQQQDTLAYLFISHDISVVRYISHRIVVLYAGKVMETGPGEAVCASPLHPYTEALVSAVLVPDPSRERRRERIVLKGEPPNPLQPPTGCRFSTRCPYVQEICRVSEPPLEEKADGRWVACWYR